MQDIIQKYGIIGKSEAIQNIIKSIDQVAKTDISVLITGDSGTGKELIAKAIHQQSLRKHSPYITVNCGAIPSGTMESELFGHKKGSFTDAMENRKGFFETADGGTILLDEIAEMPLGVQVKLLRTLEQGEITKVGESIPRKINVRILASTNKNLQEEVSKENFRKDLFYRLKTITINVPTLSKRKEDIPLLADAFMMEYADKNNLAYKPFSPNSLKILQDYYWPGNIRELRNFVQLAFIFEKDNKIRPETVNEHLNIENDQTNYDTRFPVRVNKNSETVERELILRQLFVLRQEVEDIKKMLESNINVNNFRQNQLMDISNVMKNIQNVTDEKDFENDEQETKTMQEMERELIQNTLKVFRGNKKKTAKALKIGERTLYRKINQYDLK
ncbi:MAG: sigma-54 dependent transcriptional regulator [Candidatus Marinimicrobia bacterium]|jgi:DNA-binding NtrC family response regulator|nr:sigma-54 dependent transcriptional regulator [Candidatus Neomarinimicrobiota bacterium]